MKQPALILVVDDHEANRQTILDLLDAPDYRFIEAADGPAALRIAAEQPPDLILLDVMMPEMDGFEVCRRLRADALLGEIPIIIVTALDDRTSRLVGLEAGADDFITKPFNRTELRARVRTITRLNRYRRLHDSQAALRDSEKHFRTLFALGPVAVYTCKPDGEIQDFNARALTLWGRDPHHWKPEERFGGPLRLFDRAGVWVPPEQSAMARVCRGEIPGADDLELAAERPDGSRITIVMNIAALKDDQGSVTCAMASVYDVTARHALEQALRQNEQWLSAIFDQAAVGIAQIEAKSGRFVRFNQRYCDFVGYSSTDLAKLPLSAVTAEGDRDHEQLQLGRVRTGEIRDYVREERFLQKDGSVRWASVAVSGIDWQDGAAGAYLAVLLDITERKRLDEYLLHTPEARRQEVMPPLAAEVPISQGRRESILVVDDDEALARLLQQTLLNLGYQAHFETNPAAALATVRANPRSFDLVIADQVMPAMTGLVLAVMIKKVRSDLPIILISGYSLALTAERLAEARVQQFLLKPISTRALGTAVHSALSRQPRLAPA